MTITVFTVFGDDDDDSGGCSTRGPGRLGDGGGGSLQGALHPGAGLLYNFSSHFALLKVYLQFLFSPSI